MSNTKKMLFLVGKWQTDGISWLDYTSEREERKKERDGDIKDNVVRK